MTDSALRVEIAIRTRHIAELALAITSTNPQLIGLQLAEIRQQIRELAECVVKGGVK